MGILKAGAFLLLPLAALPALAQTENERPVILSAVGDIRLDGPVGAAIKSGVRNPAAAVASWLKADIVFGNLECSLTRRGRKQPKTWNFRAPPHRLASLKQAGFTLLNIANNHSWDYGREGFLDTLTALKKYGFPYVGGGKNAQEARGLHIVKAGGLKVGFLGFTSTFPEEAWAGRNKPGVAYSGFDLLPSVIRSARRRCDVLVVSFHGGTELAPDPNDIQRSFARAAVDAGADLVLGHHPHVLQALEIYRDKPIVYSLGNFLFVSPSTATQTTVIARARLSRAGVDGLEFVAVDTHWGQPIPAGDRGRAEAYAALNRYGELDRSPEKFRLAR